MASCVDDERHAHGDQDHHGPAEDRPRGVGRGAAAEDQHQDDAADDEADADDEAARARRALLGALLGAEEVDHEGVLLHEEDVAVGLGDHDRQARDDEEQDEHGNEGAVGHGAAHKAGGHEAKADPDDEAHDADCQATGARLEPVDVADGVTGAGVGGHALLRLGLAVGEVALHELVERAVEYLADLEELVHLGVGALGLPLGDGLARDADHHGKLLLGHAARGA